MKCDSCEFNFPDGNGNRVCANEYYGEFISNLKVNFGDSFVCRGYHPDINSYFGKEILVEIDD